MHKKSELFFSLLLLPIDFLAVFGAFILAYALRIRPDLLGLKAAAKPVFHPFGIVLFLKLALILIPGWILIFALVGLYGQSNLRGRLDELGKILVGVSGGVMLMILVDFASREPIFPAKAIPIYGYGLSLVMVTLGRQLVRGIQRYLFRYDIGVHQTILIGSGPIARRLARTLGDRRSGFKLIAAIDSARGAQKRLGALPVYASLDEAIENLAGQVCDEIILADSALDQDEVMDLVNYASNRHITYRFVPNQFGLFALNSDFSTIDGIPMMALRHTPLEGWGRIIKRLFDLLGAGCGVVILSPLMLVVALAVRLGDPGPVIYRHRRLNRLGKEFEVYKFRSMYAKYCTGPGYSGRTDAEVLGEELHRPDLAQEFAKTQKLPRDPRVTPVGNFLRRTSLDELPQLFNVIKGELSLVGPRPIVSAELEHYGERQATFLALKPGVTGLWQASGRSDLSYEERVKLDIYYIENWSLWLDITILAKTVMSLLRGRGAV